MSDKASPTTIGAFVLGAAALLTGAILVFGSGRFFEERVAFVTHFDHSVTGLGVGAPVILLGVEMGSVTDIQLLVHPNDDRPAITSVYFEILPGRVRVDGERRSDTVEGVRSQIGIGMRARLASQSLVTGKLYVDLTYKPDVPAIYHEIDPGVPEVPSIPSELEAIQASLTKTLENVARLPLDQIGARALSLLESLDELASAPALKGAAEELEVTISEARALVGQLNQAWAGIEGDLHGALQTATSALEQGEKTLASYDGLLEPGTPTAYEIQLTLEELRSAARALRELAEALQREPDSIIFGKGRQGETR